MAVAEGRWRPRDTCVEVKRSREGDMSVRCSSKKLDGFTPKGYLGCVLHVKVLWSFAKSLYIESGMVEGRYLFCFSHLEVLTFGCES